MESLHSIIADLLSTFPMLPTLATMKNIWTLSYLLATHGIILELKCIRLEDGFMLDRLSEETNNNDHELDSVLYYQL